MVDEEVSYVEKLSQEAVEQITAWLKQGTPVVLLRRIFRDGRTTYEPLPKLLAELTLACIPHGEPEVERAKIIPLNSCEALGVRREDVGIRELNPRTGKMYVPRPEFILVPERVGIIH